MITTKKKKQEPRAQEPQVTNIVSVIPSNGSSLRKYKVLLSNNTEAILSKNDPRLKDCEDMIRDFEDPSNSAQLVQRIHYNVQHYVRNICLQI
jgi:hypothetical protein